MSAELKALNQRRFWLWIWILIWAIVLILFLFWTPTATNFEHTFQKPPSSPGTLRSDRWSRDFWFTGTLVVLFLIPLTAAFMSDSPTSHDRRKLHVFLVVLLFIYFVVVMILWAFDYAAANKPEVGNARNRANDDRWCCVNFALDPTACDNTASCTPGVGQADLITNRSFVFKFWMLFACNVMMILDFIYVMGFFQVAVQNYLNARLTTRYHQQTKK